MSILNKIISKDEKNSKASNSGKDEDKKRNKVVAANRKIEKKKSQNLPAKKEKSGISPIHFSEIIVKPYISEKAFSSNELRQYVFVVSALSNKSEIKKAVEKFYKVPVTSVNIIKTCNKPKKYRGISYARSGFKKAIVTLKEGSSIDVMEGVK